MAPGPPTLTGFGETHILALPPRRTFAPGGVERLAPMSKRSVIIGLVAVAVVLAAAGGWWWSRQGTEPAGVHVVVISIDTLRADHLGCYGYAGEITPSLDRLAADSVRFANVTSPTPLTLPSHATMLTGMIPPVHGVHKNENYRLADANVTLAEILQARGYATGAVVSTVILGAQFGLAQGFETYEDEIAISPQGGIAGKRRGETTSRLAGEWLDRHADDENFFLFVHYYDPHTQYDPPEPFASDWPDSPYAGEVAYADYCVGQVIAKLKALDLYDRTLIIVTSDHGEMLGEHGEATHGYFIYESAIKVPLIVKLPESESAGSVVETVAGLVDVTPTICSVLGVAEAPAFSGRDLTAAIEGRAPEERVVYCESVTPATFDANPLIGLVGPQWKYIHTTRPELYDLTADPGETNNLVGAESQRARSLTDRLADVLRQADARSVESQAELDDLARAQLESLGYVTGGSAPDTLMIDPAKDDPKDLIAYQQDVQRAMKLLPAGDVEGTIEILTRLVAQRPRAYMPRRMLARTLWMIGRFEEVAAHCDVLLAQSPDDVDMLGQRAFARQQTGDLAGALADYDRVIAIRPEQPGVWRLRGMIHLRLGDPTAAEADFTESLRRYPEHIGALMNRGTARGNRGDLDGAIADWSEVIRLNPAIIQAHVLRAMALKDSGDTDAALAALDECLTFIPPSATQQREDVEQLMARFRDEP